MLVSWNWLKEYVSPDATPDEVVRRLTFSGLNHESTEAVGSDLAIDLEVTSNRPDCLGHVGVAREIAALFGAALKRPDPVVSEASTSAANLTKVAIECDDLCRRYTARVIRGAKVGPSPRWLAERLQTLGIAAINNIVDITNYVLMESGQPLHAFDLAKLAEQRIVVRRARSGETIEAIDHNTYTLDESMCVVADARSPVAVAGVMGGASTEISPRTTELLIESAEFAPVSVRGTARKLSLHSDSSYRFERGVDPEGVEWASRRCCQLILEIAGGELASGAVTVGRPIEPRATIVLRLAQLARILGIEVEPGEAPRLLEALGCRVVRSDAATVEIVPPSWRRDLTREIDLIEEVARLHGYDKIPEDVAVPMTHSHRGELDRVLEKVRGVLTAAGYDEAMTASVVSSQLSEALSPWTEAAPLHTSTPLLRGDDVLRRSLIPSLLEARRINESLAGADVEQFEIARVYLPRPKQLPDEPLMLAIAGSGGFFGVKGVVEQLVNVLRPGANLEVAEASTKLLDEDKSCALRLNGRLLGYLGEMSDEGLSQFGLRQPAAVAEISIDELAQGARLVATYERPSDYPSVTRDLNLVVDESVRWAALSSTVREAAGDLLESLQYRETYRDPQTDGPGKKRLFFSLSLRSRERTLIGQEVDAVRDRVVEACAQAHGAKLLG